MNWNDLRFFLVVARTHSLTEASRELLVNQSTVARRISALEDALGASLFLRGPDGYELTEMGETLVGPAEEAEAQMRRIERGGAVPPNQLSGTVRVALPELLGQQVLIPRLRGFYLRFPDIHLELIADVRPARLSNRDEDVLLRLIRPTHGDYYVRRVGGLVIGLYGAPDYIARHGAPVRDADLATHRLIGWETSLSYLPLARWLEDKVPEGLFYLRTHTMGAQFAAVLAGLGLAVLPAIVAKANNLVRVLVEEEPHRSDLWLLQNADTRRSARVNAVADHFADVIASEATALGSLD